MRINRHARLLFLAALLAGGLLSGCGEPPGAAVDDGKTLRVVSDPTRSQQPDPQAIIRQALMGVQASYASLRNVTFDLAGYYVNEDSGQPGSNACHYVFEKPTKTAITVTQSTDARTVGTKLVWTGGKQMAAKTKFIGFWVKMSVDVHDPRAKDLRGYFIDDTCVPNIFGTLTDSRNQVKLLGTGNLDGVPVAQLEVVSPRSLRGIAREVFTIDGQRMLPVMREMYDRNNKLVFRIRLSNISANTSLPSTTFQLN